MDTHTNRLLAYQNWIEAQLAHIAEKKVAYAEKRRRGLISDEAALIVEPKRAATEHSLNHQLKKLDSYLEKAAA